MECTLPKAWVISCGPDDIEEVNEGIVLPYLPGVKESDIIFVGDSQQRMVYRETVVMCADNSDITLKITSSFDADPKLSYDSLIHSGIIPEYIYGGYERLSDRAYLYLHHQFSLHQLCI